MNTIYISDDLKKRFELSQVEQENGCIRYGRKTNKLMIGKEWFRAHQIAWYLKHGDIPKRMKRLCMDPKCVNVDHWARHDGADTSRASIERPEEPRELRYHKTSDQWYVRCNSKQHYLGKHKVDAYRNWERERDFVEAGKPVPEQVKRMRYGNTATLTIGELCAAYKSYMKGRYRANEIGYETYKDSKGTKNRLQLEFGKSTLVSSIGPESFSRLVEKWSARLINGEIKPDTLLNLKRRWKAVFNFGNDQGLCDVKFGTAMRGKSKKNKAKEENRIRRRGTGIAVEKHFTPLEIKALLEAAKETEHPEKWKAIILLALNAGLGPTELSMLKMSDFEVVGNRTFFTASRIKTAGKRRAYMWKKTMRAVEEARKTRPVARGSREERDYRHQLVFLSERGNELVTQGSQTKFTDAFRELQKRAGVYRRGRSIYGLRHSLQSLTASSIDIAGVAAFMGHAGSLANSMGTGANYLNTTTGEMDQRLEDVGRILYEAIWKPKKKKKKQAVEIAQ